MHIIIDTRATIVDAKGFSPINTVKVDNWHEARSFACIIGQVSQMHFTEKSIHSQGEENARQAS